MPSFACPDYYECLQAHGGNEDECVKHDLCHGKGNHSHLPEVSSSSSSSTSSSSTSSYSSPSSLSPSSSSTSPTPATASILDPTQAPGSSYDNTATTSGPSTVSSHQPHIPPWTIALIIGAGLHVLAFFVSLFIFCAKERRRHHETGEKPSYTRALKRAVVAATGIAVIAWLVNKLRPKPKGQVEDDAYKQIEVYVTHKEANVEKHQPPEYEVHRAPSVAAVQRSVSVISSLSAQSRRSQERYSTRLEPSPVSDTPSPFRMPERPPGVQMRALGTDVRHGWERGPRDG
ncbi:Uu.00g099830.m01.CDS01 [Anthostomella pinea]|uniref:Uu.00g099830.m01.CDS01 n=1 Tax=Anthostomella pinea TaxID=933095 RepID=A0AAI8YCV3_9PEZI|nr:Uu.00g099830.m01.CDS01 [Anthostomella pinea]